MTQQDSPVHPPVEHSVSGGVATVVLARPDAMNSLTLATKTALRDALHAASADPETRAVLLRGTGRAFSVGQDLREHVRDLESGPLSDTVHEHYNPMVTAIATMPKPVVAGVNGVAAGAGASLAFAADVRVLAASAGFNTAFAGIALSCDTGASWTLPRLVGTGRAMDLLLRPRTIGAQEALDLGLATQVVPDDEFDEAVTAIATELAGGPTLSYASIKRSVLYSATHDLPDSLDHEAQKMALTGASADHRRAVEAFLAKERPTFDGR